MDNRSDLKTVVFCGGRGTRMWPLSRDSQPKQFHKIIGDQSLVQHTVYDRLRPEFSWESIFISTGEKYFDQVKEQLPEVPDENFILEPEMRDTGPAVAYAVMKVSARYPGNPVAILWQDHLVKDTDLFKTVLNEAAALVDSGERSMVYVGTPPRYPSVNLGYIQIGETLKEVDGCTISEFAGFTEKPDEEKATEFYQGRLHMWNTGYFVCDPEFILEKFKEQRDEYNIYGKLVKIREAINGDQERQVTEQYFPQMEKVALDYVVHEHMSPERAAVIWADFGWSDVGEWRALKEALEDDPRDNITHGDTMIQDSSGCLLYSYSGKTIAAIGLEDIIVVDTDDVVLVCAADRAQDVKKLVKKLRRDGKDEYL